MGKTIILLAVILLLAGPAIGSTSRGFENGGSTCGPTRFLKHDDVPVCPRATQDGTISFVECDDFPSKECVIQVDVRAYGSGLPVTAKTLVTEAYQIGRPAARACEASGVGRELHCVGQAFATVEVPEGACREIRVRTTFTDVAEVENGLSVIVQAAFDACRTGGILRVS